MLDAFYWGGFVSVLGVSWLSDRFGPSRVLLIGTLLNIAGSLVTPISATSGGPYIVLAIRVVMGLGQVCNHRSSHLTFILGCVAADSRRRGGCMVSSDGKKHSERHLYGRKSD